MLAAPLYIAAKGDLSEPLLHPIAHPFKVLQTALIQAPALHLPNLTRPFVLYISENHGFALGALAQEIGPSIAPVAYLSEQLDATIREWAPCLRSLASAATLIQEAKKLTFGKTTTIFSHHHLSELLTYKGLETLPPC